MATLTLDAPQKRNAFTEELTDEFPRAIDALRRDEGLRALVITGAGTAFSAGGDLASLEARTSWTIEANRRGALDFYRHYLSVLTLEVPIIAALNGHAMGAGLLLAVACDLRFVAEGARLGVTFLNVGLHPGMGATHLLPLLVGDANAAELLFTGRAVDAGEALRIGLVNRVTSPDTVVSESLAVAREIAAKPTAAVRMTKRALLRRKLTGLDSALAYEAVAAATSYASSEMRDAIAEVRQQVAARRSTVSRAPGAVG